MRRIILSAALLVLPISLAQDVDLSGEWRQSADDGPDYAAKEFKDDSWKRVPIPWITEPRSGVYWLRRSIDLPTGVDRSHLFLVIGPVAEIYQLFVNGAPIGSVGSFEDWSTAQLPRSRIFQVPSGRIGNSSTMQLAIRLQRGSLTARGLAIFGGGTYRLAGSAPDLAQDNLQLLNELKVQLAPSLAAAVLLLSFAVLFAVFWIEESERVEFLWLSLLAGSRGLYHWGQFGQISLDSFPRAAPDWNHLLHSLNGVALAELILVLIGFRAIWVRASFWLMWAVYGWAGPATLNAAGAAIDFAAFGLLLAGWWRKRNTATLAEGLTFTAVALATVMHINTALRIFPAFFDFAGMHWSPTGYSMAFLSATLAILTMRRLTVDRREKQRLTSELEAARIMQQMLLIQSSGNLGFAAVEAVYEPAQEVGGDFYWTRGQSGGPLIVVVGDVSGKGLKAALLVSVAIGILRAVKSNSPGAILRAMNEALAGHTGEGFITCCCARFDPHGTATFANAGHPSPYGDGVELAVDPGLPLGVVAGIEYGEIAVQGKCFMLVSDGVVEAANAAGELFGFDRTREISGKSASEIADAAKAWGQNDDITVVTVRRNA